MKIEHFIRALYLNDDNLCDELIQFHADSKNKKQGRSSRGIDLSIKDSTDVTVMEKDFKNKTIISYFEKLQLLCKQYIVEFPYCNFYAPWGITENVIIQHYAPKQGYHAWHTERCSADLIMSKRHIAFLTYLNDVEDGGETEFFHQDIKIKPRKGLTVFFPVDWTYTHRGITSNTQEKYIITGWYSFI